MNQILSTEQPKNNKSSNNHNHPIDIKKIIIFFVCTIVVFGIVIAGVNVYKIANKNKEKKTQTEPVVSIEQVDDSVRVKAEYSEGISELIYYWTEEDKVVEPQEGKTSIEKLIDIPRGLDTLIIEVVDMQGNMTQFSKTFENSVTVGTSIIEIVPIEDGAKIKILAENSNGLKYIKYKINDTEEIKVDSDRANPNIIEVTIDIDNLEIGRGNNIINVVAVDSEDIETVENKTIKGQNEPVIVVGRNGDKLDCEITHDMGFEKIEFDLNGQLFVYDKDYSGYDETLTVFKTAIPLQEGENRLIITAYSLEGTTKIYKGKTTL